MFKRRPQAKTLRAYIVDDSFFARKTIYENLYKKPQNMEFILHFDFVGEAFLKREFLDQLSTLRSDLLFLDMDLPDGVMWELVPKIKELYPELIIIALADENSIEVQQLRQVYEKQVFAVLEKPFQPGHLYEVVEKAARHKFNLYLKEDDHFLFQETSKERMFSETPQLANGSLSSFVESSFENKTLPQEAQPIPLSHEASPSVRSFNEPTIEESSFSLCFESQDEGDELSSECLANSVHLTTLEFEAVEAVEACFTLNPENGTLENSDKEIILTFDVINDDSHSLGFSEQVELDLSLDETLTELVPSDSTQHASTSFELKEPPVELDPTISTSCIPEELIIPVCSIEESEILVEEVKGEESAPQDEFEITAECLVQTELVGGSSEVPIKRKRKRKRKKKKNTTSPDALSFEELVTQSQAAASTSNRPLTDPESFSVEIKPVKAFKDSMIQEAPADENHSLKVDTLPYHTDEKDVLSEVSVAKDSSDLTEDSFILDVPFNDDLDCESLETTSPLLINTELNLVPDDSVVNQTLKSEDSIPTNLKLETLSIPQDGSHKAEAPAFSLNSLSESLLDLNFSFDFGLEDGENEEPIDPILLEANADFNLYFPKKEENTIKEDEFINKNEEFILEIHEISPTLNEIPKKEENIIIKEEKNSKNISFCLYEEKLNEKELKDAENQQNELGVEFNLEPDQPLGNPVFELDFEEEVEVESPLTQASAEESFDLSFDLNFSKTEESPVSGTAQSVPEPNFEYLEPVTSYTETIESLIPLEPTVETPSDFKISPPRDTRRPANPKEFGRFGIKK